MGRIASHATVLEWMRRDFPKVYKEMIGDDPEDVSEEAENDGQRLRDEVMGNVSWAEKQLVTALGKAREHVPAADLAASLRSAWRTLRKRWVDR